MESASAIFSIKSLFQYWQYWLVYVEKIALALSLFRELLKHKRVINILPSLQAYFDKRRYFPILMSTFAHDHKTKLIIQARRW